MLQPSLVRTAAATDCRAWQAGEPFDAYRRRLEQCLDQIGAGASIH